MDREVPVDQVDQVGLEVLDPQEVLVGHTVLVGLMGQEELVDLSLQQFQAIPDSLVALVDLEDQGDLVAQKVRVDQVDQLFLVGQVSQGNLVDLVDKMDLGDHMVLVVLVGQMALGLQMAPEDQMDQVAP